MSSLLHTVWDTFVLLFLLLFNFTGKLGRKLIVFLYKLAIVDGLYLYTYIFIFYIFIYLQNYQYLLLHNHCIKFTLAQTLKVFFFFNIFENTTLLYVRLLSVLS